jgi:hypothetical protein
MHATRRSFLWAGGGIGSDGRGTLVMTTFQRDGLRWNAPANKVEA